MNAHTRRLNDTTIVARCKCGLERVLTVSTEAYNKWKGGELIQRCFPELSPEDRELLISGTCDSCWKNLFGADQ